MKIQLYVTPKFSGAYSIIRKKDGVYTLLNPSSIVADPFKDGGNYWIDAEGRPCDQKTVDSMEKIPLIDNRAFAKLFYRIPDEAEIYGLDD